MNLFKAIFGDINAKEVKKLSKIADAIEALEPKYQAMSAAELRAQTDVLKERLAKGETLDDILTDAFAVAREASVRVLGKRPFYVQLVGGIAIHQGRIAEMKTGEGKTLVATLPAYLNALSGEGVHIITVNDYLALRDKEWMGKIFRFLGLTVGVVVHGVEGEDRRNAYLADITYGTNSEFGFDYLRDNMELESRRLVQRPLNFAIVDEVDSILIDEARTPLIISGESVQSTELYTLAQNFVRTLDRDKDVRIDEKERSISLTDGLTTDRFGVVEEGSEERDGVKKAEQYFGIENLSDPNNSQISHHINQAIRANFLMKRDVDYIVKDGEIIIVDGFTGRLMYGRRYSNGLHQAIEAKEGIEIRSEQQTLATVTIQNYFRMYKKLAGMTGTAKTEEEEFRHIYNMDVVIVPTNLPVIREDADDKVYGTIQAKFKAIIEDIRECHAKGQPVLVGTISIETSELLGKVLKREGIPHEILNAKQHEREAEIVAQAGRLGAVTIATNMAGRGTDIVLGGNPEFIAKREMLKRGYSDAMIEQAISPLETDDPEVLDARRVYQEIYGEQEAITKEEQAKVREAGGLHIIGTERHESRRIDNQLRGRAGRQGDPGSSRFYLSLEDDLMRLFIPERIKELVKRMGLADDVAIELGVLSKQIESAQSRVEGRNFAIRKNVLEYDDVINKQREIIYGQRQKVLRGEDLRENILSMLDKRVSNAIHTYTDGYKYPEEWDLDGLFQSLSHVFLPLGSVTIREPETLTKEILKNRIMEVAIELYEKKERELTPELMREIERALLLRSVDRRWIDHIAAMDDLKQGISLRAIGQQDPVIAYKQEGFEMFDEMIAGIQEETLMMIFAATIQTETKRESVVRVATPVQNSGDGSPKQPVRNRESKVGRNDPCPCGSGKKYKKCCGA